MLTKVINGVFSFIQNIEDITVVSVNFVIIFAHKLILMLDRFLKNYSVLSANYAS
jgi:hypothetical protein